MKLVKLLGVAFLCTYLWGCASGAKMQNMVYQGDQKEYSEEIQNNLNLGEVAGGKKTNPAWTSQIGNESFAGAVKESLKLQGLYSETGKYRLEVQMLKVEQPFIGIDFKVTTHVQYKLINIATGDVVFDETIVAPYTAGFGDAVIAATRLRLANEGSGKENIAGLLSKLSELNIGSEEVSLHQ
ncbi:hypothetical protein [Sessilibacter sp. MAH4]